MASIVKFSRFNILPSAKLLTGQTTCACYQRYNCNRASITRDKQEHYLRTYQSILVNADGSSVRVRYEKPRLLLKLPVNTAELSEEERKERIRIFDPPKKIEVKEEIEDDYDTSSYANMLKR